MLPLPSKRLLLAACLCAACGLVAPLLRLDPSWAFLAAGLVACIALADLLLSLLSQPLPEVATHETTRLSLDRPGRFALRLRLGARDTRLRVGLSLGPQLHLPADEAVITVPAGDGWFRTEWDCVAHGRGRFTEAVVGLEGGSRFGFWDVRRSQQITADIRVYPNLFSERKSVAAVFLARSQIGARLQRTVGRGREFEKLRDYLPGDGFDEIHWKASAKRNRPITKVFQSERTQEIHIVIDASRLSGRGVMQDGRTQPLLERFLSAALLLLIAAERQGDRFGLVVFDNRIRTFIPAGHGDGHYSACREAVAALQPSDAAPDVAELVRSLRTRIRRRSLLFILTDLSDPVVAEDFARLAPPLARQHAVLLSHLPPPDIARLFARPDVTGTDDLYDRLAGHERWLELRATERLLIAAGIRTTAVAHEALAASLISQYIEARQRQVL
ncbi:DUF58 domain-containing protein [Nibricoccus sp. IMCC34717]|uniref:DUF58 domain-containing protein n=1 Tax=Nibricoccus sp. IMCC34717 TaxID=3034021 RepID=UPI00384D315D